MPSAKRLLKVFYLASRRVRVSGVYSTDMPISALDSMCVCAWIIYMYVARSMEPVCLHL